MIRAPARRFHSAVRALRGSRSTRRPHRGKAREEVQGWPGHPGAQAFRRTPTDGLPPPPPGAPPARFYLRSFGGYIALVTIVGVGTAIWLGRSGRPEDKELSVAEETAAAVERVDEAEAGALTGVCTPQSLFAAARRAAGSDSGHSSTDTTYADADKDESGTLLVYFHLPARASAKHIAAVLAAIPEAVSSRHVVAIDPPAWNASASKFLGAMGASPSLPPPVETPSSAPPTVGPLVALVLHGTQTDTCADAAKAWHATHRALASTHSLDWTSPAAWTSTAAASRLTSAALQDIADAIIAVSNTSLPGMSPYTSPDPSDLSWLPTTPSTPSSSLPTPLPYSLSTSTPASAWTSDEVLRTAEIKRRASVRDPAVDGKFLADLWGSLGPDSMLVAVPPAVWTALNMEETGEKKESKKRLASTTGRLGRSTVHPAGVAALSLCFDGSDGTLTGAAISATLSAPPSSDRDDLFVPSQGQLALLQETLATNSGLRV